MAATPSRLRAPRSPAVFVGRDLELARVLDRLQRGGVALVTGVGGLGKTALACRAVEELGAGSTAIFVGLRAGADLALELGRAFAAVEKFDAADWSVSLHDPEAMTDAVLELAEARGHVVVIDDLHQGNERAQACLHQISRLCRASRWIVTSREEPAWPGSEELVVPLPALDRTHIESLLVSCAPHVPEEARRAIATAAAGSPWRARNHLRGAGGEEVVTAGLSPREVAVLALLLEPSVPVPLAFFTAGDDGDAALLERLRRHGLLEVGGATVRLHDVARSQLVRAGLPVPAQDELQALIRALLASDQPDLEIEGVALWTRHGGASEDLGPVVRRAEAWVEAGTAERAFASLEGATDPRLVRARLVCAAAIASEATLGWAIHQPKPEDLDARLAWATAYERAGRAGEAAALAREIRETTEDPDLAARAALIEWDAHRTAGRLEEANRVLSGAAPRDRGLQLLVDARRARSLAMDGRTEEAMRACRAVADAAWERPAVERVELITNVEAVYALLGRLSEMRALGRRLDADSARAPFATRSQLARRAIEAIESGELGEGRAWLERLGATKGSRLHVHALLDHVRLWTASGEFDGLRPLLEELAELCESSGDAENLGWSRIADAYCGVTLGEVRDRGWPPELPPPRGALRQARDALARIARRRAGLDVPRGDDETSAVVDVELFLRRDACEAALLGGRLDDARRALTAALDLARLHGFALHEADLLALGADLHGAAGSPERALHFATELGKLAARMGSPRFLAEAELAALLAGERGRPLPPEALARLAAGGATSPVAARRAAAFTGSAGAARVGLDALDRLVVARALEGTTRPEAAGRTDGWRFDAGAREVHLSGGRVLDLGKHALLVRLLVLLQQRGERGASKEDLVCGAWDIREYHPLRDDKRLHVAVRRLRVLIEDDPEHPRRLITTDTGYGLRGLAPEENPTPPPM